MEERRLVFINLIINPKVHVPILNEMKARANLKSILLEKISLVIVGVIFL
jgi:hypothetical protein